VHCWGLNPGEPNRGNVHFHNRTQPSMQSTNQHTKVEMIKYHFNHYLHVTNIQLNCQCLEQILAAGFWSQQKQHCRQKECQENPWQLLFKLSWNKPVDYVHTLGDQPDTTNLMNLVLRQPFPAEGTGCSPTNQAAKVAGINPFIVQGVCTADRSCKPRVQNCLLKWKV
jgi:hypothetical protein